jgi:hypothetical protein
VAPLEDIKGVSATSDPNWLGWAQRPMPRVPDKSGEILGKTIAKSVDAAATTAGQTVESNVQSQAEDLMQSHISDIQNTSDLLQQGQKPTQGAPGAGPNPPPVVSETGPQSQTLAAARANGTISNTYFLAQLNTLRKQAVVSTGGLFTDDIDRGITKGTGISHTANAYAEGLQRDLNTFLANKNKAKDGLVTHLQTLISQGYPLTSTLSDVQGGKMSVDEGWQKVQSETAHKHNYDLANEQWATTEHMDKYSQQEAVRTYQDRAFHITEETTNRVAEQLGMSPAEMKDALYNPEHFAGKPEERQRFAAAIAGLKPMVEQQLDTEFNKVPFVNVQTPDGKTVRTQTDPRTGLPWRTPAQLMREEIAGVKTRALATLDSQISYIKDGQVGMLAHNANVDKQLQAQGSRDFSASTLGRLALISKAAKDAGLPDPVQKQLAAKMEPYYAKGIGAIAETLLTKSYLNPDAVKATGAKPSMMIDDIQTLKRNNMNDPGVIRQFAEDMSSITDPTMSDEVKKNKINYTFNPRNAEVLKQWTNDGIDATTGKVGDPSRSNILNLITSPKISEEVKRLSEKYGPDIWDNYKSTTSLMSKGLIGSYIMDLSQIQTKGIEGIHYDGSTHQFIYIPPTPSASYKQSISYGQNQQDSVRKLIDRVNAGIRPMVDIARVDGHDGNAFILSSMREMGYDLNEKTAKTFPEAMVNSIIAEQNKVKAAYDLKVNKLRQMMEDRRHPTSEKEPTPEPPVPPKTEPVRSHEDTLPPYEGFRNEAFTAPNNELPKQRPGEDTRVYLNRLKAWKGISEK